jgi:hypothetical protein
MFFQVSFLKRVGVDSSPSACNLNQAPDQMFFSIQRLLEATSSGIRKTDYADHFE